MGRFLLLLLGAALFFGGCYGAFRVRNADGVRAELVHFAAADGTKMGAMLYVPEGASAQRQAPAILAVHGFINTHEMQTPFALELARRGYVVLALDETGHGASAPPAFANGYGGPDGLRHLQSLPFVDSARIGLIGHSMGGLAAVAAALDQPDAYRALVLVGSTTSFDGAPPPVGLANVALIWGRYDEFGAFMWQENPLRVGESARLRMLFGLTEPAEADMLYGDFAAGTARALFVPPVTHPGEHLSVEAVADAIGWFGAALGVPAQRPADDQIWLEKELASLAAFIGWVLMVMGAFGTALLFLGGGAVAAPARIGRGFWWGAWLLVSMLVPALLYLPVMLTAFVTVQPAPWAPQAITNHIVLWALASALVMLVIGLPWRAPKPGFAPLARGPILAAVAAAALGFASLHLAQNLWQTDARFWVLALKPMEPWQGVSAALYFIPFLAFFLLTLRGLHARLAVSGAGRFTTYATNIAALAGGLALLIAALYAPLFVTGVLAVPPSSLQAIIAIQFVPVLAVCALFATYAYRRTNSYVPGALLCALFVTWYVSAGTATMVWPIGMG